ncbi:hypothetical protein Nepgr_030413 [Nepenthes gracilis]|uniref:Myb-like domain-containing protein n=1 Tax=Nepenthes gracilis TaxID=150966 RepID=A0AAD3TFA1_NEPGR|nr:hypothetical protein Nepgr_030413 [Nepenthes gracilis]
MAASENPSGNHHEQSSQNGGAAASNLGNGNSGTGNENSTVASKMKHNPGIATDWTAEEQSIIEDGLSKYASESNVVRYAKIAMQLPNKTVRDVALRCRWMNKKEISKRRKEEHSRKSKDKREKVTDPLSKSSQLSSRPAGQSYSMPTVSIDNDDGISYKAIGGPAGELLEQNEQAFKQICANFSSLQIQENISLFCQARDNIIKIMNSMGDTPEIMKQMPPLPVKLNEELANSILPHRQS